MKSKKKKPKIAIDIDDTIADSTNALRREVNKAYGVNLQPEDYLLELHSGSNYYSQVWDHHGIKVRLEELSTDMRKDQSHVEGIQEARDALEALLPHCDVVVVTSRDPEWKEATYLWVEKEFPGIFSDVFFTDDYLDEYGEPVSKGEFCKRIGAVLLVDDNPDFCSSADTAGVQTILFGEYGWHSFVEEDEFMCCFSWTEVEEKLLKMYS